jgi:hypothetical protein
MNSQVHLKQLAAILEADHTALSHLFDEARWQPVSSTFSGLNALVEQHIAAEEQALERLVGDGICPEALAEHVAEAHALMERLIHEARGALRREDQTGFARAFESLVRATAAHAWRAEREVLPALCARFTNPPCS